MNKKNILIIAVAVLLLGGYFGYNYMYHDHRDITKEEAAFSINAVDLAKEFSADPSVVSKYLNKTISIKGTITEVEDKAITVDGGVYTMFDESIKLTKGSKIEVKGRCIGYDELLELVKLDQTSVVE